MKRWFVTIALVGVLSFLSFGVGLVNGRIQGSSANQAFNSILIALLDWEVEREASRAAPVSTTRLESTFIRFGRALYRLPDSDDINGGALGLWDETLLVMTRTGRIATFSEETGFIDTTIVPPDNGVDGYYAMMERPEFQNYDHRPVSIRFNDIHYVDRDDFRGLLVSYSFYDPDRVCAGSRLARLDIPRDITDPHDVVSEPEDWRVLFETTPCLDLDPNWVAFDAITAGGRFDIHPDGRVIFGSGDYHRDGIHTNDVGIQDPETSYGKVLAIDYNTGAVENLAIGHRNMQGVAVDEAGEIWVIEHGVRGGDELNHIKPGENHGWPLESLGTLYNGQPLPVPGVEGRHDAFDMPAFAWLPSTATSALTAISDFHPAWDGGLLAGSLASNETGESLWHIRTEGERVVFAERIELGRRVRYVTQWGDKIAVWVDGTDLIILTQQEREDPLALTLARMEDEFPEDIALQAGNILGQCAQCHAFTESDHSGAPSLYGLVGRNTAGTPYGYYSDAILGLNMAWTKENLVAFLTDPDSIAPGTVMPPAGLREGPVLDAVIWGLSEAGTADQALD